MIRHWIHLNKLHISSHRFLIFLFCLFSKTIGHCSFSKYVSEGLNSAFSVVDEYTLKCSSYVYHNQGTYVTELHTEVTEVFLIFGALLHDFSFTGNSLNQDLSAVAFGPFMRFGDNNKK